MAKPSSKVAIVNLALSHLKTDPVVSIEPPDEDSKAASAGAKWYDQARRHVLEDHPWKFASKRTMLVAETDAPEFEYSTAYELPANFVRVNRIGENWEYPVEDYEIEGDLILCNESSPLYLKYVWDITDVTKFTPKFITALSYKLASFMAYEITGNATAKEAMETIYDKELTTAGSVNGQNRPTRRIEKSKLRAARLTGSARRYNQRGGY